MDMVEIVVLARDDLYALRGTCDDLLGMGLFADTVLETGWREYYTVVRQQIYEDMKHD